MTRARELSRLGNPNIISADSDYNVGIGSTTPDAKLDVIGIVSATSFYGDGSGLTGVASTDNIITSGIVTITNATDSTSTTTGALQVTGGIGVGLSMTVGGDVSIGGTVTYEDVTNIDSVGIITARSGIEIGAAGVGGTISAVGNAVLPGDITLGDFDVTLGISSGCKFQNEGIMYVQRVASSAEEVFSAWAGTSNNIIMKANGAATFAAVTGTTGTFTGDVDIADKIVHTGDTNTALRFPSADTITAETGGSERLRIDSSGKLLIGTSTAQGNINYKGNVITAYVQQVSSGTGYKGPSIIKYSSGDYDPILTLGISNSNTVGTNTLVGANWDLGALQFVGNDGTNFATAAYINCSVHGTAAAGDMPGLLRFATSASGSVAPTERLVIDSSGTANFKGIVKVVDTELQEASDNFSINIQSGNNDFYVNSGGTTFAAFKGSAKDLQLTSGNLVIGTAGKGIDFSAQTATTSATGATTNSEILDHYEEGTWTPTLASNSYLNSGTWAAMGQYTKIGNIVTVHMAQTGGNISWAAPTWLINDLPFAAVNPFGPVGSACDAGPSFSSSVMVWTSSQIYIASAGSSITSLRISITYRC